MVVGGVVPAANRKLAAKRPQHSVTTVGPLPQWVRGSFRFALA